MRARISLATATLVAAGVVACSSNTSTPPASDATSSSASTRSRRAGIDVTSLPGNSVRVTYRPTTVVIERAAAAAAIQSVSTDESVIVVDANDPAFAGIEPGRQLLIKDVLVRRVAAVKRDGGRLGIRLEPTTLPEVIDNGTIAWRVPIKLSALAGGSSPAAVAPVAGVVPPWLGSVEATLYAAGRSISGGKKDWKYTLTAAPGGPGRAQIGLHVTKNVNNIDVALDASADVPDFDSAMTMAIADGAVTDFAYGSTPLGGTIDLSLSASTKAGQPGGFGTKQLKLPAVLKVPFFLGGLPFTMQVAPAISFTPGVGSKNQLATARFRVSYSDLRGFSVTPGQPPTPESSGGSGDGQILDASGLTLAAIGIVAGASLPRVEFKVGTTSIVDALEKALPTDIADVFEKTFLGGLVKEKLEEAEESIKTEGVANVQVVLVATLVASGPLSIVSCQRTALTITASAGADASVLGKKMGEAKIDLFKREIKKVEPPIKACE